MIEFKTGDLLTDDAEALVNTVNCVGVMGRGIALQFKKTFPKNFAAYQAAYKENKLRIGKMFLYETGYLTNPRYIVNFPTKRHWRENSRIEDIAVGLDSLVQLIKDYNIRSIALPPLGAGLGGLSWTQVRPMILEALGDLQDVKVSVYEPKGAPSPRAMAPAPEKPRMTAGRAALVALMHRYLAGLLDPFVTLLEIHKLMYFMQEAGEQLRLRYTKHHYGPFAVNLRHVLNDIEGHYTLGYADGGDAPYKEINLMPNAMVEAEEMLKNAPATSERLDRVGALVTGFETPFGLELLSSVHWIISQERASDVEEIVEKMHSWGTQKTKFGAKQIAIAVQALIDHGWAPSQ